MNKWYLGQTQPYQLKDLPYNWVLDWDLTGTSSGGTFLSGNAYLCKPNQTDHCILFFRPNQTTSNYNRTVKWSFAWDLTGTSSGEVMLGCHSGFGPYPPSKKWKNTLQNTPLIVLLNTLFTNTFFVQYPPSILKFERHGNESL